MRLRFLSIVLLVGCSTTGHAASLTPDEAAGHVGETATVCGVIASTSYAPQALMAPTFLDIGRPYPNQLFSAIIFGNDRPKFGIPENSLRNKSVCVTGEIFLYQGAPKMILRAPSQLSIQ
jgi:hypothetical protein